jgi:hypothetical protein
VGPAFTKDKKDNGEMRDPSSEVHMRGLIALIAGTLITTGALANDTGDKDKSMKSADHKFQKLDRDNDGRLSEQEARRDETVSAQFAAVDQDSDGFVNRTEFTAMTNTQQRSRSPSSDYDSSNPNRNNPSQPEPGGYEPGR